MATMLMSDFTRDNFIAPGMSAFTEANIPDLSDHAEAQSAYQAMFILNASLRGGASLQGRQLFFNVIRRTNSALDAYGRARARTLSYLEEPRGRELTYIAAVDAWEAVFGYTWQALQLIANGTKHMWFTRGDGSSFERLNGLHNTAKHADGHIARGTLHGESPIGVWLTNDGFKSVGASLTFKELSDVLVLLFQYCDIVRDPITARELLAKWVQGLTVETA